MTIKRILLTILLAWFIAINLYAYPYLKKDVKHSVTRKLENMIVAINGRPSLKIKLDENLVMEHSLPPSKNIAELAQKYPAADSDIIGRLLDEKVYRR